MGAIRDLAERFWRGEVDPAKHWTPTGQREEIVPGLWFLHTFANIALVRTGAGLVMIDTAQAGARRDHRA